MILVSAWQSNFILLQIQEEFTWFPLADCVPQLEKFRYAAFVHPEHSLEGPQDPGEGMAGWSFGNVFTCPLSRSSCLRLRGATQRSHGHLFHATGGDIYNPYQCEWPTTWSLGS
jgi:hypothetical protein